MFIAEEHKMATYTTYSDMRAKLEQLQDFQGSSATGGTVRGSYIVRSYAKPIFTLCTTTGCATFDNRYYSKTTSKLQNLIKKAYNLKECKERKEYKLNVFKNL